MRGWTCRLALKREAFKTGHTRGWACLTRDETGRYTYVTLLPQSVNLRGESHGAPASSVSVD
jgi:protocatechuate 3,4-dioxygenase beta subunit